MAEYVETRHVPIGDLEHYPGNPRISDEDALRASVSELGQFAPLIVRERGDGRLVILSGNHTADALQYQGHETARVDIVRCTDAEARKIVAAANRIGDLGGYDKTLLAGLLSNLDGDLAGTGYDEDYLDALLRDDVIGNAATGFLAGLGEGGDDPGAAGPGRHDEDGHPGHPAAGDFVAITWLVTPPDRQLIRDACGDAQKRTGAATSALALVAICRQYLDDDRQAFTPGKAEA